MKSEKAYMAEQLRDKTIVIMIVIAGISGQLTRYAFIIDEDIRWVCAGLAIFLAMVVYSQFKEAMNWHRLSKVLAKE